MSPAEWVALVEVFGVPGSIILGALFLRRGTLNAGSDVGTHVDAVKAELKAVRRTLHEIEQRMASDARRFHEELAAIRDALSSHKLLMERRLSRLETKVNGQTRQARDA